MNTCVHYDCGVHLLRKQEGKLIIIICRMFLLTIKCQHLLPRELCVSVSFPVISLYFILSSDQRHCVNRTCHMSSHCSHLPKWSNIKKEDTADCWINLSKHDWCECTLLSLQLSHISGHTWCVKASCLFRSGLKMNLTYPSSLCMVCSDRGYALCEIEVGSLQYPALSVFLSL